MLQIQNELSFHLHNHGNLRRQKFLAVSINTNNEEQYLFTTFPGNEKLIPERANDWLKWIYKKYPQKKFANYIDF